MILKTFSSDNNLLLSLCSEATLNHWSFEGQKLRVALTTYDDDELNIYINTDIVRSSPLFLNKNLNICRMVIQDMHEILDLENGYYIPPNNFSNLMKFAGMHYSLYYGRKSTVRYNLAFLGNENFLSCLIISLDNDITWEIE